MSVKMPPWQVIVIRCFFFLIALGLFSILKENEQGVSWGRLIFAGGIIFLCLTVIATFVRSRWAHVFTAIVLVLLPFCFFILMDLVIFSHSNEWYAIMIATVLWMAIPIAFSYEFLANKKVQTYYGQSKGPNL